MRPSRGELCVELPSSSLPEPGNRDPCSKAARRQDRRGCAGAHASVLILRPRSHHWAQYTSVRIPGSSGTQDSIGRTPRCGHRLDGGRGRKRPQDRATALVPDLPCGGGGAHGASSIAGIVPAENGPPGARRDAYPGAQRRVTPGPSRLPCVPGRVYSDSTGRVVTFFSCSAAPPGGALGQHKGDQRSIQARGEPRKERRPR